MEGDFILNRTTKEERNIIKDITRAVTVRAAKLSAMAIGAVLDHIQRLEDTTVAIDGMSWFLCYHDSDVIAGGVFEHLPGVQDTMKKTLSELYPNSNLRLVLTKDGSGHGAAVVAATAQSV